MGAVSLAVSSSVISGGDFTGLKPNVVGVIRREQ